GPLALTGLTKLKLHFNRIEAEHYDHHGEAFDVMTQDTEDTGGGRNVGWINDGSYICWNEMNFQGITGIKYRVASAGTGGRVELRQGSPSGTLVSTSPAIAPTGGWQAWVDVTTTTFSPPTGTHKFCFVFKNNANDELLFNLNYIDFIGPGVGY